MEDQNSQFREIFEKSPIGIFFYDKNGITVNANSSALKMLGFSRLGDVLGHNLFDNPYVKFHKEELIKNGWIRFESPLNLDKVKEKGFYTPTESGIINIDYTISITDSGYLAQIQDITDRKKAEEALKESEKQYYSLFKNNHAIMLLIDPKTGNIIDANPAAALFYGYSIKKLKAMKITDINMLTEEETFEEMKKAQAEKKKYFQFKHRLKSGKIRYVDVYSGPIPVKGKNLLYSIIHDVTNRKKAKESLYKSEMELKRAQQIAHIGSWTWDIITNEVTWSDESYRIYGLTPREVEPNYELFLRSIVPEDRERVDKEVRKAIDTGKKYNITYNIIGKDGAHGVVRSECEIITDNSGKVIKIYGTNQDITKRQKAEKELKKSEETARKHAEELETIMDMVPAAIFLSEDPYCKSIHGNKEADKMYEVERGSDVSAGTLDGEVLNVERRFFKDGKELKPEELPMQMAVKKGKDILNYEMNVLLPSGQMITMFGNASPLFDNKGKARGCLGVYVDITKLKHTEKALKEARDNLEKKVEERTLEIEEAYQVVKENESKLKEVITDLERSNRELQSFAYITSHDLQEPLRSIASYAQLIKRRYEGQLDSDADEFIEFMVSGATRLQNMIKGLLEYSRLDTQGEEFKDFNAEEALNSALSGLKSSIEECHVEVISDSLPVIHGDEGQISRVFQNLISNAIKFRKPKFPPKIHISAYKTKDGKGYVFSVQDNGIGMEKQYSDRIFEVFKRLHPIGEYEGTGIGLAIVKRIIERHGGRVWIESELGVGSTFYFTIPIEK